MLPEGGIVDATGNVSNKFSDWKNPGDVNSPMNWASNRMVFVAHNSPDDVAAAAAGVIGGVDPWVSRVLKPVGGITQAGDFTDQELLTLMHPDQVGIVQPKVNPVVHPEFFQQIAFNHCYFTSVSPSNLMLDDAPTASFSGVCLDVEPG
jgi:hypothetical protein